MNDLIEIPMAEITSADVGLRIVVTRDGNAFDGMLTDMTVSRSDYDFKDRPRVTARLKVKTVATELTLKDLPLDYRVQIERPDLVTEREPNTNE